MLLLTARTDNYHLFKYPILKNKLHMKKHWRNLKSDSHLQECFFICFNHSPSKMMKNVFYFILKALFVLKIFKFLS